MQPVLGQESKVEQHIMRRVLQKGGIQAVQDPYRTRNRAVVLEDAPAKVFVSHKT